MSTARLRPLNTTTNTTATNPKATHYSKPPTPTMEATFTLKVNSATQRGTQKKKSSTGGGGGNSIGSSEASDPLESDYSGEEAEEEEEDDDEEEEEGEDAETDEDDNVAATTAAAAAAQVSRSEQKNTTRASTLTENDSDKENAAGGNSSSSDDDDDDESEVANKAKQTIQKRTTETTTTLKKSNAMDTAKGARTYNFDDFQLIKTVGTGTFGRVCLCRDRLTEKYCAMKILAMTDVIRLKQVDHVKNEKNILCEIKHPFVISLEWSTKDDCCLYMIFEYISGGELFTYLRNAGRFNCQTANFFAAETVSALEYLHSLQIVYRDLKPENLLINRDGHLKITDFGFAKKLRDRTWTLCGTPEYLAPEIIQLKGHNKAVDWWALGILIYEMIVGYPPFYDENPIVIYEKILSGKIEWPRHMDPIARDLIKKLLTNDRTKRLGNMKNGADDVKRHRWFKHLNWNDVYSKKLKPPFVPDVAFDGDTSNFDDYPEKDWKPARAVDQRDLQLFIDF